MREIKLIIQKEEDILLLECAVNWMRERCLASTKEILDLNDRIDKMGMKTKFNETITMKVETYDRLMSLLAQLDNLIEKKA
jgi:hypothetical protein